MNKLEIINESISEIRDILGAECANIEDLPEMVKQLAEDPARSGFTTAFVFSSESSPIRPEGGKLNTETGLVEDLEPSWSQKVERATTFSLRAMPEPTTNWMSFAIFNPSGEKVTEWSTPVNLKGAKGEQGIPGEAGATGPQGPAGPKGDSSNSYRTVSVYTTTEDTTAPSKPIGGRWDLATNTVTPPSTTNDKYKWYLNADEPPKNNYLWMSQATFGESGDLINAWCEPFRLTGEAGKSGADGRVTEFIYRLLPDLETYNELSKHLTLNKLYSPEYEDDKVPSPNDDFNIDTIWTDQPKGITETMQIEVCCTRTRKGVDQPWGKWSNCIIWSKWGEDGMDGDGVEYIYLVTPDTFNGEPITSAIVSSPAFMPNRDEAMKHKYYQQDEFCFNGNWAEEYKGYDWTDEPKDVGPGEPLEWVSVRKKRKNEKGVVEWGRFSDPAIWGRFAEDGYAYKTSFVFTRSIEQPNPPTGGSFDIPKPIENNWYNSIPPISAANNIVGPVWMSSRTFYAGDESFDPDWTYPTIMADSQYFQVEYTHGNEFGLVPGIDPFTGDEDAWRKNQLSKYQIQWGDDDKINDPIWMATATCDNGVWSNWVVTRIKGEKGDKGENGASVKIKHKFANLDVIKAEWDRYLSTGYFLNDKLDTGDGFYAEDTGLLWVYSGGYDGTEEDTDFDLYWQGVALKGEPGDSAYLYTAFANIEEGPINFVAGKWIGVRPSDKALNPDLLEQWGTYTWTKWQGEDGWGQEQVFLLTSKNANFDPANGIEPALPINEDPEYKEAGYLPLHNLGELAKGEGADRWADSPLPVSEEWPYCWVVSRKMQGETFGPWKGDSDGDGAALYSRYSYDGLDGKSPIAINLTNDLVVIPMEDDLVDPDFIKACADNPITTGVQVFIGDDPVDNEDYDIAKSDYFTVNNEKGTLTLNVEKVGNIKEIPVTVTVGSNEYKTTWKILKTDVAYVLEPSLHVIKRYSEGDNAGSLENPQFTVKVWKWSDYKWIASGKALFAKVSRGTSEKIYSNKDNSGVVSPTTNGVVTVNLSGIKDITGVRLFVTSDDIGNESNTLSFKDIAIVADGPTGPKGDSGQITEEEKAEIENAVRDAVLTTTQNNLDTAKEELSRDITAANEALEQAKTELTTAINEGKQAAIEAAQNDAASKYATVERLNAVDSSIENLNSKFDKNGQLVNTALNEGQIYDLSIAALGKDVPEGYEIPEGEIHADSYFGRYFAGSVGVFGDLIADQITATTITGALKDEGVQGLSIYSGTNYDNSAWALEKSGAGKIANGQISWNEDGSKVELGENVTLSWGNISDADSKVSTVVSSQIDNKGFATQDDIDDAINNLPEGLTRDDVKDVIAGTYIDGSMIATDTLYANQIVALDEFVADKISGGMKGLDIWANTSYEDSTWGLNSDGSGKIANGAINWDAEGIINLDGVVLNPVSTNTSDVLNKTIFIGTSLSSERAITISGYLETTSITKVGTVTIISSNSSSPSSVHIGGATISIPSIKGTSAGNIESMTSDYSQFILAPGSITTFDVYDDAEGRHLIPQQVFGWFNYKGTILPYSINNGVGYEEVATISGPQTAGTSLEAGEYFSVITVPEQTAYYMSIKLSSSLHSTYGSIIKLSQSTNNGSVISQYTSDDFTTETYVSPINVKFREGGDFGFINTMNGSITSVKSPTVTVKLYNKISMIAYFNQTI